MHATLLRLALASAALALAGCTPSVCDRNEQVNLMSKAGNCGGLFGSRLLGDKAACTSGVAACPSADQSTLLKTLDCLDKLQVCAPASQPAWLLEQQKCLDQLQALSTPCSDALFGGVVPGQDAGPDAGPPDAGPQPSDGGSALVLEGVADESDFALAWTRLQPGDVARWVVIRQNGLGVTEPDLFVTPSTRLAHVVSDAGTLQTREFFVAGLDLQDAVAWGNLDAGTVEQDAGPVQCQGPLDCPPDRVCDLNQCKVQTCQPGAPVDTCPQGYQCYPNGTCNRQFSDAGTFDAGVVVDAGAPEKPLPFVSNLVRLTTGPATFGAGVPVGGFPGRRADIVGIDTARVLIALEQEGQVIAHYSSRHGRDLEVDYGTTSNIDTVGSRVKVTYNPESQTVYACYNVGRGVRVRRSTDFGRTWGASAATIEPADDGGFTSRIADCDIAPWRNGEALMVAVEDDALTVRTVSPALSVGDPTVAFLSSGPDAGNVFAPANPAIATLPSDSMVHVTFTGTRGVGSAGGTDSEPYGVYRDGATGGFTQPRFLSNTGVGNPGTGFPQDWTTVAIDPKSKRSVAAYVSLESGAAGSVIATIYVSLWNSALRLWGTSSDLNVFVENPADGLTSLLFPGPVNRKTKNDRWFAFSPQLTALPGGKIYLSFVTGPIASGGISGDYRQYVVPFDFDLQSPASTARGWFVRPVTQVSTQRVFDPRIGSAPPPPVAGACADTQLTVYTHLLEGLGAQGEIDGRVITNAKP